MPIPIAKCRQRMALITHSDEQSILAPMSGLSVVWNIMLSPYLLKESLRHTDVLGTVFVVVGCMIVGLSGCHDTPDHPTAELLQLFVSESFLMYMLFSGVWISAVGLARKTHSAFGSTEEDVLTLSPL